MIHSFSGDPFLATRAARSVLRQLRPEVGEFTELAEDLTPEAVLAVAGQSGLFGAGGLYLDFDTAFKGQPGVKPRNAMLRLLPDLPADMQVIVVDSSATDARQKQWRNFSEHRHLPSPRFQALERWVAEELDAAGVQRTREVPRLLVDMFGEDLPAIASEIGKLSLMQGKVDADRLREATGKDAFTDAFGFIDALVAGDPAAAIGQALALRQQGEDAVKVLAAVSWQFTLVARCVGLLAADPRASDSVVASVLKLKPFVAAKVRRIASRLDEQSLRPLLAAIATAELASKSGRDSSWALERLALEASRLLQPA